MVREEIMSNNYEEIKPDEIKQLIEDFKRDVEGYIETPYLAIDYKAGENLISEIEYLCREYNSAVSDLGNNEEKLVRLEEENQQLKVELDHLKKMVEVFNGGAQDDN